MKWFYNLKNSIRVLIAACAWIPFIAFLIAMAYSTPEGETMPMWAVPVLIVLLVAGIAFTIFAVLAYRKEHPKAEKAAQASSNADGSPQTIIKDFYSKVVGVTFDNDDGSSRQKLISQCNAGDDIIFRPVPTPDYPNAIGVFTANGKQLGHVRSELADELCKKYPTNPMSVTISEITGGQDGKSYGCNLHIIIYNRSDSHDN